MEVKNPHPAILIFSRLEAMNWNHLYAKGAVEDQDPMLLQYFDLIHRAKAKEEKRKADQRAKDAEANKRSGGIKRGGGRGRRK